jgi:peroxiredoxin Q/BCP
MSTQQPSEGDHAPAFTLADADGRLVSLSDFAERPKIVYFYPKAMTPGCTTEACDFTAAGPRLGSAGYSVIGISPDPPEELAEFRSKEDLDVVLLSDPDKEVMTAYGAYGEKQNYGKTVTGVIRSTFVIDGDDLITRAWRNVKASGHVGRVLESLGIG